MAMEAKAETFRILLAMLFILGVLFASLLFQMFAKYLPQPPGKGPLRVANREPFTTGRRRSRQFLRDFNIPTRRQRRRGCIRFSR